MAGYDITHLFLKSNPFSLLLVPRYHGGGIEGKTRNMRDILYRYISKAQHSDMYVCTTISNICILHGSTSWASQGAAKAVDWVRPAQYYYY